MFLHEILVKVLMDLELLEIIHIISFFFDLQNNAILFTDTHQIGYLIRIDELSYILESYDELDFHVFQFGIFADKFRFWIDLVK